MLFLTFGLVVIADNSSAEIFSNYTEEIFVIGVEIDAKWCGK